MSAPSMPPDNSMAIRQMEMDASRQAQARQDAEDKRRREELAGLRTSSSTAARGAANDYFTQRGLDPGQYASGIDNTISQILASIGMEDPNPGSYFTNIGERIYGAEEAGLRARSGREIDQLFAPNFETQRLPWTTDDPFLAGVEGEQRSAADKIIDNMFNRGVITGTGRQAAMTDLDRQAPTVRSQLNEIGTGLLASGQQGLRDIANRGRQTASTLNLGQSFDPYSFGGEADASFTEFMRTLGDTIRARAPGNLFNTAGLGAIAGAGMGAQNMAFDPNAIAGIIDPDKDPAKRPTPPAIF